MKNSTTICAISTAPGQGAIAIVRLSGPQSITIGDSIFFAKNGKPLTDCKPGTFIFGIIQSDDQTVLDEVMLSIFKAPHSYTGEHLIEIYCHGSAYIQQQLLNLMLTHGAHLAEPGEFTLRAFLNGNMDLSQAEAVADLIHAESKAAHQLAMNQMKGGYSEIITDLRDKLLHFCSLLELELDFGEEEVEFADRKKLFALLEEISVVIQNLIRSFQLGNVLKNGIPVVISGPPNAGKSTLLNTIVKDERAIVSEIPGTTRDAIDVTYTIHGTVFRFTDTAGLHETSDQIEIRGIKKTREAILRARIVFFVLDASTPLSLLTTTISEFYSSLSDEQQFCLIFNKEDTISALRKDELLEKYKSVEPLFISALSGSGMDALSAYLSNYIAAVLPQNYNVIVSNVRHYEAFVKAQTALASARQGFSDGITTDLLTIDIRHALHYLSGIIGDVTTDEVLGNIFKGFCIGK